MRIPHGLARFSLCCSRGRMARCLLPASFGSKVYPPRAPSLVPLSSLPALSLPKSVCKQEFASCLVLVTPPLLLRSWQRLRGQQLCSAGGCSHCPCPAS